MSVVKRDTAVTEKCTYWLKKDENVIRYLSVDSHRKGEHFMVHPVTDKPRYLVIFCEKYLCAYDDNRAICDCFEINKDCSLNKLSTEFILGILQGGFTYNGNLELLGAYK